MGATFISTNMIDGPINFIEESSAFACDILSQNDKTYIFRTKALGNTIALQVAELTPDLKEINPRVSFYFSGNNSPQSITRYKDEKVILTVYGKIKTSNPISMDVKDNGANTSVEEDPIIYMGIMELK